MWEAFNSKPVERDGQLVFDSGNVRLVYEAFDVPRTEELFAVLGDPTLSVDESELRERARSFRSHG